MVAPQRPSRSLHGKVAIVSGAGAIGDGIGNGRASAILLAEAGAAVVCCDLDERAAGVTADMISKEDGIAMALKVDVTNQVQCKDAVARTIAKFGRLDILINIVGIMGAKGTAVDVDMDEWAKGMELNVASMVKMSKYAIPEMVKNTGQQCRGSIVNLGSVAGIRGGTPHLLYPTTKGAIVNMTRSMAAHHAADGIRVNCVCPGMLFTPMMYGPGMTDDVRKARADRSLLKTEGNGWDCGAAVRFLASDEARWITGLIMPVDAGESRLLDRHNTGQDDRLHIARGDLYNQYKHMIGMTLPVSSPHNVSRSEKAKPAILIWTVTQHVLSRILFLCLHNAFFVSDFELAGEQLLQSSQRLVV